MHTGHSSAGRWQRYFRPRMLVALILVCIIGSISCSSGFIDVKTTAANRALKLKLTGQAMPDGDMPGWHQIFAEDFPIDVPVGSFPGSAYGSQFTVYADGTPDTAGQQGAPSRYYPSKVVSVRNGLLNMYLHTENGTPMAAAILPILPGNHLYGKYTLRFRSDALSGFKTAWLLWPDSENWPHDGEIDFPEGSLDDTIGAFLHPQNGRSGSDQDAYRDRKSVV